MDLLLQLLIAIVRGIYREVQGSRSRRVLIEHGLDADIETQGVDPGELARQIQDQRTALLTQIGRLLDASDAALVRADETNQQLQAVPSGALLRDVLGNKVRPALEGARTTLLALRARADEKPSGRLLTAARNPENQQAAVIIQQSLLRVEVITAVAAMRQRPEDAAAIADADAIATAMLTPIQAFASDYDLALRPQHPVAVPADAGAEAIWFGLLPEGTPILFVPADFERDLFRFASVPHEIGHLLWRDLPGLSRELRGRLQLPETTGLFRAIGGRIAGSIELLYSAWLPEIWADAVALWLLGPAALRGLVHSFSSPEDPQQTIVVGADVEHNRYDEHPPAHLRIQLADHVLSAMGFSREAELIMAQWSTMHGPLDRIIVPVLGAGYLGLPLEPVLARGRALLDAIYSEPFRSLAGLQIVDIPGFMMSPGLWARVLRRAEALGADQPFNDDARVVLAAAIEERARKPSLAGIITRGLRRAILGRDAGERKVADANYARKNARHTLADELKQAMVLRELLHSRGGITQSKRRYRSIRG